MALVSASTLGRRRILLWSATALLFSQLLVADARRIVSVIPSTTEMLFAMGAGDRVIAVGNYDNFPAAVEKLSRVGGLIDPNVERILSMRPDLVVVYATQTDFIERLKQVRIPYYLYSHKALPDVTETIRSLGAAVGLAARANTLANGIDRQLAGIRGKVANRPRPKTLVVFGREHGTLRAIDASGGYGFLHDMLETAGGTNVLGDLPRQSVLMTTEMVLARAPDVIIELHYSREADSNAQADLNVWNTVASVPAVKNRRVYVLTGEEFVVPGPRVAAATERIARTLHPEVWKP